MKQPPTRACHCGRPFEPYHGGHKYCTPACRPLSRDRNRAWRAANPERKRAWDHAWRARNPDRLSQQNWRAKNPDKVAHFSRLRRARLASLESPGVPVVEWAEILAVFGGRCAYCLRADRTLTRDHVVPISRGGLDEAGNVVPACQSCNSRKGVGTLLRFVSLESRVAPS